MSPCGVSRKSSPVPPLTCDRQPSSFPEAQYSVLLVRDVTFSVFGEKAAKPENYDDKRPSPIPFCFPSTILPSSANRHATERDNGLGFDETPLFFRPSFALDSMA